MCILATGSCIDLPLIIMRVIYWWLPTRINLCPLDGSIVRCLYLNLLHPFILVTVPKTKGGWEGLNKGELVWVLKKQTNHNTMRDGYWVWTFPTPVPIHYRSFWYWYPNKTKTNSLRNIKVFFNKTFPKQKLKWKNKNEHLDQVKSDRKRSKQHVKPSFDTWVYRHILVGAQKLLRFDTQT